jgi:hypothetical protein
LQEEEEGAVARRGEVEEKTKKETSFHFSGFVICHL